MDRYNARIRRLYRRLNVRLPFNVFYANLAYRGVQFVNDFLTAYENQHARTRSNTRNLRQLARVTPPVPFSQIPTRRTTPNVVTPSPFSTRPVTGSLIRRPIGMLKRRAENDIMGARKRLRYTAVRSTNTELGDPVGMKGTKIVRWSQNTWTVRNENTIYSRPLIKIEYNSDLTSRQDRSSKLVHLTGLSLNFFFKLKLGENATAPTYYVKVPLFLRWAIISNKESMTIAEQNTGILDTDFFENSAPSEPTGGGTDYQANMPIIDHLSRRINRRKYNVLKEGRKILQRDANSTSVLVGGGLTQMNMFCHVKEYVRFNRQISFASNTLGSPHWYPDHTNVFFVYWAVPIGKDGSATGVDEAFVEQHFHKCYFRTPKNYFT